MGFTKLTESKSVQKTDAAKPLVDPDRLCVGDTVACMIDPEDEDYVGKIKYMTIWKMLGAARVEFHTPKRLSQLVPLSRLRRVEDK